MKQKIEELFQTDPGDYIAQKIKAIPTHLLVTFLSALLFAFLIHGFGFSNKLLNEDSLFYLRNSMAYLYQSGRWFLVALQYIRGMYTIPWLIGIAATFYLALATTFMISLLGVTNKAYCVAISLLTVAFPAWANQFMYDFMADAYPAAMLLSILSIYFAKKYRFGFLIGAVCLMLSLALYQSFLSFAIGLSLISILCSLLNHPDKLKITLLQAFRFLLCGALGLTLYFISVRVSLLITGGALWGYQGLDTLGQIPLSQLPELIRTAYLGVRDGFFLTGSYAANSLFVSRRLFALYVSLFILLMYLLVRRILNAKLHKHLPAFLLFILALLLLPLALNISVIMAPEAEIHTLNTNPFVLLVLLVFVFLELPERGHTKPRPRRFVSGYLALILAVLIGGNYWVQSGTFYFVQHIQYEHTFSFYNRLLTRIESTEGFSPGMEVAIIGTEPFPYIGASEVFTDRQAQIVGFSDARPVLGLGEQHKFILFAQNYLGVRLVPISQERREEIMEMEVFEAMPLYPKPGSIAIIEDVLVVRLN